MNTPHTNAPALQNIVAGFDPEAFGSQAVFRVALDALSHPGRVFDMPRQTALSKLKNATEASQSHT
jgi:alpha-D-ribose 1-methylphosphonate 5-triphosphate synthase subunit PhnH